MGRSSGSEPEVEVAQTRAEEPKTQVKPEAKLETQVKPKGEPEAEAETEVEVKAEPETEVEANGPYQQSLRGPNPEGPVRMGWWATLRRLLLHLWYRSRRRHPTGPPRRRSSPPT